MPTFLVERYAPGPWPASPDARPVGAGASQGTERGGPGPAGVRLVLSAAVPGDEIALGLFEAPTEEALATVLRDRGLPFIRIVEAVLDEAPWNAGAVAGP